MKAFVRIFSVLLISLVSAVTFGSVLDIDPVIPGVASFLLSSLALPGGLTYYLIFTAPGGVGTPFTFNFVGLPQYLTWNNIVPLTSLRIETKEDGVLHDWVAASIAVINGFQMVGAQAANIVLLRLANGSFKNRNVTLSGVTSAAGAINFFGKSTSQGTALFKTINSTIIAGNPTTFAGFTAIWTPTMATLTDRCEVNYTNGLKETIGIEEMAAESSYQQEVPQIQLNNSAGNIASATFVCAANTAAYVMSTIKV